MNRHVTYLLTAYVHDELPPHLQERVSRHVRTCDACYAALCQQRDVNRALHTGVYGMRTPCAEHLAQLLPGILAETTAARPAHRVRRPGLGLAVGLSMFFMMLMPALVIPRVSAIAPPQDQPPPQMRITVTQHVTDAPVQMIASPTTVPILVTAQTQPPALNPSPAPVVQLTSGG